MVSIKSPVKVKDLEGKVGLAFKALLGIEGSKKELYDSDKMLVITLDKGECVALSIVKTAFGNFQKVSKGAMLKETEEITNGWFNLRKLNREEKNGRFRIYLSAYLLSKLDFLADFDKVMKFTKV